MYIPTPFPVTVRFSGIRAQSGSCRLLHLAAGKPVWLFGPVAITGIVIILLLVWLLCKKQRSSGELQRQLTATALSHHFLANACNGLMSLLVLRRYKEAERYLRCLMQFSSYMLETLRSRSTTLAAELNAVLMFTRLYELVAGKTVRIDVHIDPALQREQEQVPPFVLQPVVENALLHGFRDCAAPPVLSIAVLADGPWMLIKVTDNGCGYNRPPVKKLRASYGIDITRELLRRFNRSPAQEALYVRRNEPAGSQVTLRLRRRSLS